MNSTNDYRIWESAGSNIVLELKATPRIYLSISDARAMARKLNALADMVEKHEAAIRAKYMAAKKP